MEDMIAPLKRYAQFTGRASRREYWMFQLFLLLLTLPLGIIIGLAVYSQSPAALMLVFALATLIWLATIVPLLAVTVRRLHDINQSGWMYLLAFVPLANVVLLVFMFLPGTPGENQFGAPAPRP